MIELDLKDKLDRPTFKGYEELYDSFVKEFNNSSDKLTSYASINSLNLSAEKELDEFNSIVDKEVVRFCDLLVTIDLYSTNGEHGIKYVGEHIDSRTFINKLIEGFKIVIKDYQSERIPLPISTIKSEEFKSQREKFWWIYDQLDEVHESLFKLYDLYSIKDNSIRGILNARLSDIVFKSYSIKKLEILYYVTSQINSTITKKGFENIVFYDELVKNESGNIEHRNNVGNPNFKKEKWSFPVGFFKRAKELNDLSYTEQRLYNALMHEFFQEKDKKPSKSTVIRRLKTKNIR